MTDDLKEIDLSAWEVPEPPQDLADSVIARVGGTDITPSVPVEEPTIRRRALLVAGVAVAVLVVTLGTWALVRDRAPELMCIVEPHVDEPVVVGGPVCDADGLKWKGLEKMDVGQYAAALADFDASLRCKLQNDVLLLAAQAACKADSEAKVQEYSSKLPANLRAAAKCFSCDANALKEQGLRARDPAKALALFEKSLACKHDATVVVFAYEMACSANDLAKAKHYYDALATKPKTVCSPTTCDANDLKAQGMRAVNMGQHAVALLRFEESLACKSESEVIALAFMAACNAGNASKARTFYGQLSKAQQSKYAVMCDRNGIDVTTTCNASDLKEKGMEHVNMGQHAAALSSFEASLACKSDSYVLTLAFMAACNAGNATKANALFPKLTPTQQSQYKVMCERNHVALAASCDASDLKDKGMEAINNAEHAQALALFEQSLACKRDPYVTQLAYISACNAKQALKARAFYRQMTTAQQTKYKPICIRNGVDLDVDDQGYLQVFSKPAAKILVDGQDTGLTTPVKQLALAPGKHKVTFVIGQDRYTYAVTIVAGQTESLSKDLQ